MKRLLTTLLLIACVSFPTFGGHTQADGVPCVDGTPGCVSDLKLYKKQKQETPTVEVRPGILLAIALLALMLRSRI